MTIAALTLADSDAPRISRTAHRATRTSAGRLIRPGSASHGAEDSAVGISQPIRLFSSWFR